jgi:hypothetical protein
MDPCPFDASTSGDADGDGLPDVCDPNPGHPGMRRCLMTFSDTNFNSRFWVARGTEPAWANAPGALSSHGGPSEVTVAAEAIEAPGQTTTYDAAFTIEDSMSIIGGTGIALRQSPVAAQPTDVGCSLYKVGTSYYYGVYVNNGPTQPQSFTLPATGMMVRMRASMTPAGADGTSTIRCVVWATGQTPGMDSEMTLSLPEGHFGMRSEHWSVTLHGLDIFAD